MELICPAGYDLVLVAIIEECLAPVRMSSFDLEKEGERVPTSTLTLKLVIDKNMSYSTIIVNMFFT